MVLQVFKKEQFWRKPVLAPHYDVVVIGGGVHGLSTAYHLAKLGVKRVAVLDKSYLGAGASGRNTAIIRSNYLTTEGIAFMNASLKLYEQLAAELSLNVLFSQIGRLDIAHTESTLFWLRQRVEYNRLMGVDSRLIEPRDVKGLVPQIDLREGKPFPIVGALTPPTRGSRPARRGGLGLRPCRRPARRRAAPIH